MNAILKPIAISLLAVAISASVPAPTHATGMVAGATEFTQISNNVQLVVSYAKQLQQYKTQLDTFKQQVFALRQMDPSKLKGMLKGALGLDGPAELEKAFRDADRITSTIQNITSDMDTIYREGAIAVATAKQLADKGIKITPGDYVSAFRGLGRLQQDTYGRRLTALNDAAKNAMSDIKRVEQIAASSEAIQTNVEGFQTIAQANAIMSNQLGTLTQVLTQQTTQDAEVAKRVAEEMTDKKIKRMQTDRYIVDMFAPQAPSSSK